ncbi:loganic acid O-methyltransferase-like [Tripterygium wilfordii]|uniref:loganic acid O-methyltransferase-like n=1 Tax=Tripterygium wilfordii TaxID=458696 RepID=UPI0018F8052E|nr:loganic acid O-methyltransferase-like [Tripterygium wilfordii]XP_038687705.1 loganic acid O-methyltransferase-like [Tripterygium wilfordii]XP_038687706.1 loganic acid O-methyltransferase-like [Tripterygium wilfordii]XP_038687707.1 loganic acid O-methyltransferase-like [Tripterygium wilfordii]XP_038687708.1 loganic acid O-methyltransferase-like [Tripterygium wilfordii]XP_038687709.1 loganic acid O-methyltransferase-like [Tripterygium wilfordii]XP_038687710.1 loganic acid O-methyltransferase
MATELATTTPTSMNKGDGEYSYSQNSQLQRNGVELIKVLIKQGIAENLDLAQLFSSSSPKSFKIVDLGCSVGRNTFTAVQNIIQSVKLKYQTLSGSSKVALEFQVFFNDLASNDFNTLFKNLPLDRKYFCAAVPGPFQGRLFPEKSIHFIHSSFALHWLSNAPKELMDRHSPSYNKGRIYYPSAPKEVSKAYATQFGKDIGAFLDARAQEVVHGGLMAILILCIPDGVPYSQCYVLELYELLGTSISDMANEGLISEDKVDSFNLPIYNPTEKELKALIEKNACFSIEKMEPIHPTWNSDIRLVVLHFRAAWEGLVSDHFGNDIIDDLFDRLLKKVMASHVFTDSTCYELIVQLFVLLKRNDA